MWAIQKLNLTAPFSPESRLNPGESSEKAGSSEAISFQQVDHDPTHDVRLSR